MELFQLTSYAEFQPRPSEIVPQATVLSVVDVRCPRCNGHLGPMQHNESKTCVCGLTMIRQFTWLCVERTGTSE